MLTVNKQEYLHDLICAALHGQHEWYWSDASPDFDEDADYALIIIKLRGHEVAPFFGKLNSVFSKFRISVAADRISGSEPGGLISMEIGIHLPQ